MLEAIGPAAGSGPEARTRGAVSGLRRTAAGRRTSASDEALVTAPRYLLCSRCHHAWVFSRMTCAGCGEQSGSKLPIYGETERLPHLRVDACDSCGRYLVTVDLRKDPGAVPIVDELAAAPLDLYAREQRQAKDRPEPHGDVREG